jgi:methylmalonyl-CoA mutase
VSTRYFLEVAKLRALRLLVPQIVDAFADAAGESVAVAPSDLFVQAVTSQRAQTVYDPHVNMLRGTTQGMAAVLGGCDVLTVAPYDAALDTPDAFSDRIARNTSLILQEEAHLDRVADPAAG